MVGLMATSSKRAYAIPKSAAPRAPSLWQSTADPYLHRRCSNTVLSQSLWGPWVLVQGLFEPSEHPWWEWGLIPNVNFPLVPSCWGFFFALGHGVSPYRCSSAGQPPLQHLPSCWHFSELGLGVCPHGCSSGAQLLLQSSSIDSQYLAFLFCFILAIG